MKSDTRFVDKRNSNQRTTITLPYTGGSVHNMQTPLQNKGGMAERVIPNGDEMKNATHLSGTPEQKGLQLIMDFTRSCLLTDLLPEEHDVVDPRIYLQSRNADNCIPKNGICFTVRYQDGAVCAKSILWNNGLMICTIYDRDGGWLMTPWNVCKSILSHDKRCTAFDSIKELNDAWKALRKRMASASPLGTINLRTA